MFGKHRSLRQIVKSPLYVSLGPSAGGFLRDLSEGGLGIELFGGIACNQVVQIDFDLPNAEYRVEAIGQICGLVILCPCSKPGVDCGLPKICVTFRMMTPLTLPASEFQLDHQP